MAEDTGGSTPSAGSPPQPPLPPPAATATAAAAPAMDGPSSGAAAAGAGAGAGATEDTVVTVNIKQLNGPDFELAVRRDELVSNLKSKVREQTDIEEVGIDST